MVNSNISLDLGSGIKIKGLKFTIDGYIVFRDSDGATWTEYKLKSKENFQIRWLTVDKLNNQYAVYSEESYSKGFLEENIKSKEYKETENKSAKVEDYRGNVDVDLGEEVFYKEYEDITETLLISVENWGGQQEFSKGYYIKERDIQKLEEEPINKYNPSILNSTKKNKIDVKLVFMTIFALITIILTLRSCVLNNKDNRLSKFIASNSDFKYETSITSDLDQSKKANVYSGNMTVEEAAKLIISGLEGNIEDVQENQEDGTVGLLTKDEMALVYTSKDSKTLIQVSSREYVYSSRTTVYSGSSSTNNYYRSYYYNRGYSQDQIRYKDLKNGYSDYKSGNFSPSNSNSDYKSGNFSPSNSNSDYKSGNFSPSSSNKYKIYSDSIRQSSVNSRSSSGDGISSGK
ncbi:DUF4178 domain-containing protein [Clostridium sp. CX1]|uniref:DUF4178 domain-containing protein n=1 Tax=Clostridium sp. CX1 TaxID=2978346 RepID=UPI0021C0E62A|nr:DUF4178 domain-containing protein [Clostridium sp. CX1]MCT8977966.1 DUF4178 domain-containing protein [Clostridium sp. CX1]